MLDLKYAIRQLFNSPGFTCLGVLTLGLCIGANLTIFAALDAIVVRLLPFRDADRLVVLHNAYRKTGVKRAKATITNYYERRGLEAFESLSMFKKRSFIVGEAGSTRRVDCAMITPEFFQTLGVPLVMGQTFTDDNLTYKTDKLVIITDQFWRDDFNADPDVLGRSVVMDGLPLKVIAVLPPGFRYLSSKAQIFRPLGHGPEIRDPMSNYSPQDRLPLELGTITFVSLRLRHLTPSRAILRRIFVRRL